MPEQKSVSPLYAAVLARCPRCGKGRLFKNVLETAPGVRPLRPRLPLHRYGRRAGGIRHLHPRLSHPAVCALYVEFTYEPPVWVHVVLWGALTPLIALVLLRFLKSMLIALQYRNKAEEGRIARD